MKTTAFGVINGSGVLLLKTVRRKRSDSIRYFEIGAEAQGTWKNFRTRCGYRCAKLVIREA